MNSRKMSIAIVTAFAILSLLFVSCAPATLTAERYALVIGISDYINSDGVYLKDLTYPRIDADSVADLLTAQGWTVEKLTDTAATKTAIQATIDSFFRGIGGNATALIYYSGHGTDDSTSTYLVPSDYDPYDKSPLVSAEEMYAWIDGYIVTRNVIFIADSCFSGGFVDASDSSDVIDSPYDPLSDHTVRVSAFSALSDFGALLAKNSEATGQLAPIAISAAGTDEFSWETEALGNGIFTYFLVEAAAKGDANEDGYVTCTEAFTYAAKSIDAYWNSVQPRYDGFYPHISGGLRDLVLFSAGN
jgi:uncharacterized caspase-like protein